MMQLLMVFLKLINSESNELESKSNAVIVLGPTASQPTQVLAVLNGGNSELAGLSLSQAIEQTTQSGLGTDKGSFLMTNSSYISGSNIITATTIAIAPTTLNLSLK